MDTEIDGTKNKCLQCSKTFSNRSNLKKHVKKFHSNKIDELAPGIYKNSALYSYTCNYCEKNFNHKWNFNSHVKIHTQETSAGDLQDSDKGIFKCPMCSNYECNMKSEILDHFKNVHDIIMTSEQHIFESLKEFEEWKLEVESKTLTRFRIRNTKHFKKHTKKKYICHRSGHYVASGKGQRKIKVQGSCKINGYCPASMTVYQDNQDNNIKVNFITSHVGHQNKLGYLTLTPLERNTLASKIAAKIPFDEILNEVRDSISDETLKRIHLLNRQDLYNIERSFNLTASSVRHQNDAISVEAWINQMHQEETVLFYKPQGIDLQDQPTLKSEDFVLVIMTPAQQKFLQKYGTDCICLDGTHGLNGYDFELTTLMVLDDLREGFPAAFLISNRCDKDVMLIFFSNILLRVGVIRTNVFMSDLADSYFNAWIEVMGPPEKRLFCTWHLLRAWRKNLSKIKGKEQQDVIYKQLRTLLQEQDQIAFEIMIKNFCSDANVPDYEDFKKYFRENYFSNRQCWAYCYRLNCGVNTNMHLERMHGMLKYIYLKGKKIKRLDKAIHAIMRMVRDKLIDRLIVTHKGKLSRKLQTIRQRHKTSIDLDLSSIVSVENGWEIFSQSHNDIYFIQEYKTTCSCKLLCTECAMCIHKYRCSCFDSSIKFNMCKHSHLVARYRQTQEKNKQNSTVDSDVAMADDNIDKDELHIVTESDDEGDIIIRQLGSKSSVAMDVQKNNVRRKIERHLQQITDEKEMEALNKVLAPISPVLAAIKESRNNFTLIESSSKEPSNKRICPQRRLFSTKKKQKKNKKNKTLAPTAELDKIAVELLHPK